MPDPTKDVPGDAPTGQSDGRFNLGALGLGMPRAARVGTVIEPGDEMDGAVESEEVTMSMIADIHQVPADGAVPVDDIEFQESEIGVLGPVMWHGVDFRVVEDSLPIVLQVGKEETLLGLGRLWDRLSPFTCFGERWHAELPDDPHSAPHLPAVDRPDDGCFPDPLDGLRAGLR